MPTTSSYPALQADCLDLIGRCNRLADAARRCRAHCKQSHARGAAAAMADIQRLGGDLVAFTDAFYPGLVFASPVRAAA